MNRAREHLFAGARLSLEQYSGVRRGRNLAHLLRNFAHGKALTNYQPNIRQRVKHAALGGLFLRWPVIKSRRYTLSLHTNLISRPYMQKFHHNTKTARKPGPSPLHLKIAVENDSRKPPASGSTDLLLLTDARLHSEPSDIHQREHRPRSAGSCPAASRGTTGSHSCCPAEPASPRMRQRDWLRALPAAACRQDTGPTGTYWAP